MGTVTLTFYSFETSAAIIKRAGWKIQNPKISEISNEAVARSFIKSPLQGDKRQNWEENRFRLLCVQVKDRKQILAQKSIVNAASESGWINSEFASLIDKKTMGSAVLTEEGNISLMLQTPQDDWRFTTLSISELKSRGRRRGSDWVCLLFLGPDVDSNHLASLLSENAFPSDYAPLFPDFMFLPVCILKKEVELVGDQLTDLKNSVLEETNLVLSSDPGDLGKIRNRLFVLEQQQSRLHERWRFSQGLAENITKCFGEILRLQGKDDGKAIYSKTLRHRVDTQVTLLNMLQEDLDAIVPRIEYQHRMIVSKLSIMVAEDTRRDSASMKTIAVLTLVFLPATATASVFGMPMFDWQAKDGDSVVSKKIWIYVVVALSLTLVVLLVWILWFTWSNNRYEKKLEGDVESAKNYQNCKYQ